MPRKTSRSAFNTRIGRFRGDRLAIILLMLLAVTVGLRSWLTQHPEHNPWTPLDLRHPIGWATANKFSAIKGDISLCRATLQRSEVPFGELSPSGEGACTRTDRTQLTSFPLAPGTPPVTCPVAAALEMWRRQTVEPAARNIFGTELASITHLGAFSCRRLYGRSEGAWSEHATANAIDISGFTLKDGTRISVLADWDGTEEEKQFLREVRDGACGVFATVLSPDYNTAHADHFHFDQADRWNGLCR